MSESASNVVQPPEPMLELRHKSKTPGGAGQFNLFTRELEPRAGIREQGTKARE
jgi:hypothetical protein